MCHLHTRNTQEPMRSFVRRGRKQLSRSKVTRELDFDSASSPFSFRRNPLPILFDYIFTHLQVTYTQRFSTSSCLVRKLPSDRSSLTVNISHKTFFASDDVAPSPYTVLLWFPRLSQVWFSFWCFGFFYLFFVKVFLCALCVSD